MCGIVFCCEDIEWLAWKGSGVDVPQVVTFYNISGVTWARNTYQAAGLPFSGGCFNWCLTVERCWSAVYIPSDHTCLLLHQRTRICTSSTTVLGCLVEGGNEQHVVTNRLSKSTGYFSKMIEGLLLLLLIFFLSETRFGHCKFPSGRTPGFRFNPSGFVDILRVFIVFTKWFQSGLINILRKPSKMFRKWR